VLAVVAAAALVGIYLGIAAVAHLTPWQDKAAPSASPGRTASAAASGPASAAQASQGLLGLIPAPVRAGGCPGGKRLLGATEVRNCTGVPYGTGRAVVTYYLFADKAALEAAYGDFLTAAKVRRGGGNCADFRSFRAPCETAIRNAHVSPVMTGRAVEFTHQGFADIVSSDEQRHLLLYATARDGQALLSWWLDPHRWLVTG
jgi:hypothetical protein